MSVPPNETITTPPPPAAGTPTQEARQWAMFAHLSALTAFITGFGAIVGPLIIWQIKKNEMPFVDDQGKEALNFNITAFIICLGLWVFTLITFGIGALLTVPVFFLVFIGWLVFTIIAGIKANEGVAYRYPFAIRLVK
ncbi:MAG TPA: DUF4870 domain-containing protein [Rudaea sp.]|nr:DUF4870 domain-containing protein [Rudaea sp.]